MGTLPPLLHSSARPVALHEFAEAVRATCPPRFPTARVTPHRSVALAISGGVDSMALAFLCAQLHRYYPEIRISDNPIYHFRACVVDHALRDGSAEEASAIGKALRKMGLACHISRITWSKVLGDYRHPRDLPNFETLARRLRYRRLGSVCASHAVASLFLAHHEDDQYETVLMRLLQGHSSRGLRGMRKASDLPECEGQFRAWQSGYVDDQSRKIPFYKTTPTRKQRSVLRRELRSSIGRLMTEDDPDNLGCDDNKSHDYDVEEFYQPNQSTKMVSIESSSLDVEDGGVFVYRPLLEFSKDRLIATCLANDVPWWDDQTNQDATFTMRNAVRHLYKNHSLPVALQKPAVLALSKKCEDKAEAVEAEANRLLRRVIFFDFRTTAGTLTVKFPGLETPLVRRTSTYLGSAIRQGARVLRLREVAGVLIKKVIAIVSPELQAVPLSSLQNVISRIFPFLSGTCEAGSTSAPKAFNIAGIHFLPVQRKSKLSSAIAPQKPSTWYLSRAPHPSSRPVPRLRSTYWGIPRRPWKKIHDQKHCWKWSKGEKSWTLWDGRFWIRIKHRLPYRVIVQPFLKEHAKAFRDLMDPDDQNRLTAVLKRYAPGKVRYTLPALYLEEELDLDNPQPRSSYPSPLAEADCNTEQSSGDRHASHPKVIDVSKIKLLALPTLDIQARGLDKWLAYEIRYRKVDRSTFGLVGTFSRGCFMPPSSRASKSRHVERRHSKPVRPRRSSPGRRSGEKCSRVEADLESYT